MIIGIDDIVLSIREYILNTLHETKLDNGTFEESSLSSIFTNLIVLPRGLDFNPEDYGPRIGITIPSDSDEEYFFGEARFHRWYLYLEVDSLIKNELNGKVDPDLSLRTMWKLNASLRQLFDIGKHIELYIWGESGAVTSVGYVTVSQEQRMFQTDDATFVSNIYLEKIIEK